MSGIMINTHGSFLEIIIGAGVDIYKFLRVPVDKRKPGILNLDHDPVSLFKSMRHISH
jgi:hypothetical protein